VEASLLTIIATAVLNEVSHDRLARDGGDSWHRHFVEGEVLREDEVTKVDGKLATPGIKVIKLVVFVANATAGIFAP
jgi:hypothetical protein